MITSKQRATLRKLGHDLDTIYQIGKGGFGEEMLKGIDAALDARELIKLRTLDNCDYSSKEAANIIAEELHADVVSVVGSRFVLYRQSSKEKNRKIIL
ncbi:MAG: YhbY family RNA-binding protein [Clostridia bacterium]|nr:YhbY family RNA-binding protein [Clostridia bacterium]